MQKKTEMELTAQDHTKFNNSSPCYLCNACFTSENYKVSDRCHRTGKFRGACRNQCDIKYYSDRYLPVAFHKLRGYDSHSILKRAFDIIGEKTDARSAIPQSGDTFMSFQHW